MTNGEQDFYDTVDWNSRPKTKLGLILTYDDRDFQYSMGDYLEPVRVLPRKYFYTCQTILNQGDNPWCVGAAWKHFLLGNPLQTQLGPSMLDIYNGSRLVAKIPPHIAGSDIRAAAKFLQSLGHIDTYLWTKKFDDVRYWLLNRQGMVVIGSEWWSGMSEPDRRGEVHPTGIFQDYHAWCLAGWSDYRQAFRGLNSWGTTYGENGRNWLSEKNFNILLERGAVLVTAKEKFVGIEASKRRTITLPVAMAGIGGTLRPLGR